MSSNIKESFPYKLNDQESCKITLKSLQDSFEIKIKNLFDLSVYKKKFSINEILEYKPFMVIEEFPEIFKIIHDGFKKENNIKLKKNKENIDITFDVVFTKIYSNTFTVDKVEKDESMVMNEISQEIQKLKKETQSLRFGNENLLTKINYTKELYNHDIITNDKRDELLNKEIEEIKNKYFGKIFIFIFS